MANDNNIKNFTAADIEKYHRGLLSAKQMHDLEKAALDDPFLADALEGYAVAGVNAHADIIDLKKRLADKLESKSAKVVTMHGGESRKSFPWLRAAAAVVIIAGGTMLANQFLFTKNKSQDIAQVNPAPIENKKADSNNINTAPTAAAADTPMAVQELNGTTQNNNTASVNTEAYKTLNGKADVKSSETKTNDPSVIVTDVATATSTSTSTKINEPKKETADKTNNGYVVAERKDKDEQKSAEAKRLENNNNVLARKEKANEAVPTAVAENNVSRDVVANGRKTDNENYRYQNTNVFRGRVTDANNIGVPFANVTNVEDKVGTYTDANGNFNLTSPDTVLTVQVRSIGFENNQAQLRNAAPTNQVVMRDDRSSLSEVVISNAKPNAAARNRDLNKTLEEPEPADGWDNYDTYLVNNLETPDELKTKPTNHGAVQVSFEVDKNGEPTSIRVEKSLCGKCDKEAIRLIKQGPKWKRNANKKGRTTVTINF